MESTEGDIYVAMSSSELCTLADQFQNAGGKLDGWIIWEKNTFTLGHSDFQRQFEPIMLGHSGRVGHENPVNGVWVADKPTKNKVHPTMKPIELVQMAIKASSHRGDAVLDLFGGSGSTLIACEKTGRKARLMEQDPVACDQIVQRWEKFTGKKATRK